MDVCSASDIPALGSTPNILSNSCETPIKTSSKNTWAEDYAVTGKLTNFEKLSPS
jgi:hypothetical protein